MNCGLRHFGNDVMQLSCRHASICANFSFNFVKKFVRDQRWPTAPSFIVNISPSVGEFTAPLRHILQIHNVTMNSSSLWISAGRSPFALRNRMTERTAHLAGFCSALPFQTQTVLSPSNEYGSQVKDQGRQQCCHNKHKKFPYPPTRDVSLLSGHTSYKNNKCLLWGL